MAWIESHQSLLKHKKTLATAGRLSVDRHKLIGHLHALWWWGLDNVGVDGCLGNMGSFEVATAAEWDGDADAFTEALIYGGFIDSTDGGLYLHEWYDYAGRLIEAREAEKERSRRRREERKKKREKQAGEPKSDQRSTSGLPAVDQRETVGTVPYRTLPNTTNKDIILTPIYTDDFTEFWEAYPRRIEKRAALKAWTATLKGRKGSDKPTAGTLIACAKHYAAYCMGEQTEQRYIKHPSTFLGPSEPWRDWIEPRAAPTQETPVDRRLREAGVMF